MSQHDYAMIVFSSELSGQEPEAQKQAVRDLWSYIADRQEMWAKPSREALDEGFRSFIESGLEISRAYANAFADNFRPEVYRGNLSRKDTRHVQHLGFDVNNMK